MTDFTTPAEFRADLQRRFDAFDDVLRSHRLAIAEVEREREMVALQIATIDRVMALQDAEIQRGIADGTLYTGAEPPPDFGQLAPLVEQPASVPQPAAPRQRADVRGPVIALIRNSADELSFESICRLLPDLKPASIRATLTALVDRGVIQEQSGLYWAENETPSSGGGTSDAALAAATPTAAANPDDRHSEDGGRHPGALASGVAAAALAKSVQENEDRRVPRHIVEPEPPDARVIRDTSPEALAANLRAAIEHAGPSGLNEENACIPPIVIAAGIEAGWLERTEDDRGPRLWLREGAGQ